MSDLNGGKRTVKRRPASKSARATPRKPKTKAKRKSRSRTTSMSSKYSEEPHTRVQEGGAKRKAGRKTSHSAHESRSGVKELAVMGDDRLRMGLVPSLPLQLMLDPELKRKVAMADPRVSDIFSKYGPGWSGYQLGLQSNRNMPVVELESQIKGFPAVGMDLQSHPLAGYLRGSLGPFTGYTGPFGPSGPRNPRDLDALAASTQLGTTVKVMDMDRLPEDALDVKGEISPFGFGLPDAIRVAGLSKQGKVPRPGQFAEKPKSESEPQSTRVFSHSLSKPANPSVVDPPPSQDTNATVTYTQEKPYLYVTWSIRSNSGTPIIKLQMKNNSKSDLNYMKNKLLQIMGTLAMGNINNNMNNFLTKFRQKNQNFDEIVKKIQFNSEYNLAESEINPFINGYNKLFLHIWVESITPDDVKLFEYDGTLADLSPYGRDVSGTHSSEMHLRHQYLHNTLFYEQLVGEKYTS